MSHWFSRIFIGHSIYLKLILIIVFSLKNEFIFPQNQYWENVDGPDGGIIYSITLNGNDTYCAGEGGVFRSNNYGENWECIGLNDKTVHKISIVSENILAITNSGCFRMALADTIWMNIKSGRWQSLFAKDSLVFIGSGYLGVFRSIDLGDRWDEVNNGINNKDIEELFITSNNTILASASGASGSGVFRSVNLGDSWTRIDPYQFAWNFEGIAELNNNLYAFNFRNYAPVYKSTDFGQSWFLPSNASAPSDIIQSIYVDETGIYVSVYHYGVFTSNSEGKVWSSINDGLSNKHVNSIIGNGSQLFIATFDGFHKSSKANFNWEKKSEGINNCWISSLEANENNLIVGSYGSGLFIKNNNGFERLNLGTDLMFIIDVLVANNQINVLSSSWSSASYAKYHVSFNKGISWIEIDTGFDTEGLECMAANSQYIYIGSWYGVFRKSINGFIWEKLLNGIPNNINVSGIASSDSVVIVTNGTSQIYRSADLGNTWQIIFIDGLYSGGEIYSPSSGEFYLGSQQVNNLFHSADYGTTWQQTTTPLYNADIQALYSTNNEVFIGLSNNGILSSTNNGQNWINSNTGLGTLNITSFQSIGNKIFAGSKNNGIYTKVRDLTEPILENKFYSNNQITLRWTSSYKIHNYRFQLSYDSLFHNLIIDERNIFDTSYTVINLDYNKVYYWRVSSITKYWDDHFFEPQKIKTGNPNNYMLYQNYPNPFNNQTIISFDVPNKSFIELNLFDVLGRKIKTLLNEQKDVGSHKYFLSNTNLASGVYILNLKSVGFSKSIKIVLLQ